MCNDGIQSSYMALWSTPNIKVTVLVAFTMIVALFISFTSECYRMSVYNRVLWVVDSVAISLHGLEV